MNKTSNSSGAVTVTIGNGYSAEELAQFKLPGYPVSRKGWYERARRENWEMREEPGKGPGGIRQLFVPPPDVLALIEARQRGDIPPAVKHGVRESIARYGSHHDDSADSVFIDKYVDVRGSAGPGAVVQDEAIVKVRVDAKLLRERVGSNFSHIKMAGVSGDSMEPTLSHGDQVLVDTSVTRIRDNAIYAIQQDGFLRFKRVKLKLDGSVIVKSDASPDDVETYTAEEAARFFVIGEVIPFKFGRFKV